VVYLLLDWRDYLHNRRVACEFKGFIFQDSPIQKAVGSMSRIAQAPPSRFAYSSSMRSSYRRSACNSSSVFCACVADATLCVDGFSTSCAVCAVAVVLSSDLEGSVLVGTGIVVDVEGGCGG
jgi:hypothetical protein